MRPPRVALALLLLPLLAGGARADATGTFRLGGAGRDYAFDLARDGEGNLFLAGAFTGTVDFDPGPEVAERTSRESGEPTGPTQGRMDAFVVKYDAEGKLAWVLVLGGSGVNVAQSLAVDDAGGLVVGGHFSGSVDFDPSDPPDAQDTLDAVVGRDAFVARYEADGALRWVVGIGDEDSAPPGSRELPVEWSEGVRDVALDAQGRVYAVGMFRGTVDLDPSEETVARTSVGDSRDAFLVSYDEDGRYRWDVVIASDGPDQAHAVAVGPQGRLVVGGVIGGTLDFDPGPGEAVAACAGAWDAFLAWYDADGTFERVRAWGGPGYDQVATSSVSYDPSGAVYAAGDFSGRIDFDRVGRKREPREAEGVSDAFLLRFEPEGDLGWVLTLGAGGMDKAEALTRDRVGNVVVTGFFRDRVDFAPGGRRKFLEAAGKAGATDAFVASYDERGKLRWASAIGAEVDGPRSLTRGTGLAPGAGEDVLVTGVFFGSPDLDPGRKTLLLPNQGEADVFVVRYDGKGRVVP